MAKSGSSSKVERKILEKERRVYMKNLCVHLASLIPNQMKTMPLTDQLHEATNYIKILEKKKENLNKRKNFLLGVEGSNLGFRLPTLEVKVFPTSLEVVLISESFYHTVFYEAIRVLGDEGAEIVSASFHSREGKVFHTIYSRITDPGISQTTRICEKFKNLVQ